MAKGFTFDGTDDYVSIPDAAVWDFGMGSFVLSFWINPDTRTAPEVLFHRANWFTIMLYPDGEIKIDFNGVAGRSVGYVKASVKQHVMLCLEADTPLGGNGTVAADSNVASFLIDTDATFATDGFKRDQYVYNRTDRTWGKIGTPLTAKTFTAGAGTVNTTTETVTVTAHGFTTGIPVVVTGADVPAGLTSTNTYFVNAATANTLIFYDSAANAIAAGATGKVDLTDVGSGTVTLDPTELCLPLQSDVFPDGNEVYYIFGRDGWNWKFRSWINGVLQQPRVADQLMAFFNPPADTNTAILVGELAGGSDFYDGLMNEVAIWSGVATNGIATAIYNQGTELEAIEAVDGALTLLGHWSFDETAAATAVDNDEGTSARDGTASNNASVITVASIDPTSYYVEERTLKVTSAVTLSGRYIVESMRWTGSASNEIAAEDDLVVQDGNSNDVFVSRATANDFVDGWAFGPKLFNDIKIATIDGGELFIYLA